jgi:hypothetical protein
VKRTRLWLAVMLLLGCRARPPQVVVPISPRSSPSPQRVRPGEALALEYRWEVAPGVPRLGKGLNAFVHFVDAKSGSLVFTDDHPPVPPPEAWEGGQNYTYKRVVLVPELALEGPIEIRMGLFSGGGQRLALQGVSRSRNEYATGRMEILGKRERPRVVYGDGWYAPEAPPGDPFSTRRWMQREAQASFRNLGKDVILILSAETNHIFPETPVLTVAVLNHGVRLPLTSPAPFLERIRIRGKDLGGERRAEVRLTMTQSFVPKLLGLGDDSRDLSLWVHGLLVEDMSEVDPAVAEGVLDAVNLQKP